VADVQPRNRVIARLSPILTYGPIVVTVVGSAVLALFAATLQLSEMQMLQCVLGILALIATSLLAERALNGRATELRLNEMSRLLADTTAYARQVRCAGFDELVIRRRDLRALEQRLSGARRVAVYGGSLSRLVNEYQGQFEALARNGCDIRFLMTDPGSDAVHSLRNFVVSESDDMGVHHAQVAAAAAKVERMAASFPEAFQAKFIGLTPPFSMILIETTSSQATIEVEMYGYKIATRDRPILALDVAREPRLFHIFAEQFEAMWTSELATPALRKDDQEAG